MLSAEYGRSQASTETATGEHETREVPVGSNSSTGMEMTDARPARARVRLLGFIFLIVVAVQGCAHTSPPVPLSESVQQQLGKVGVVATPTERNQAFNAPGTGRLHNTWRGLVELTGEQVRVANELRPYDVIGPVSGVPILMGLIIGPFYGAVKSEPWQEAEATFRTIVAELNLNQTLPQHLVAFAQAHGYAMTHLSIVTEESLQKQSRYVTARNDGIDTVLEIQDLTVNLVPAGYMVNPYRVLTLSVRVQLIRTVDQTLLDDRVVTDTLGPALLLDGWAANQAARFRQEVQQAAERLAEQIITEYFLLYPIPERVSASLFLDVHLKGLRLFYPIETEFPSMVQKVDSLQPTMSWESFSGANLTYDLNIWRAGRLGPEALVYSRTNLDQASHKLETALEPSSRYYWSVRAHFSEHGKERITDWSRRLATHSLMAKILTLGILAIVPNPGAESFFMFITPPPPSLPPQPADSQSK